MTNRGIHNPTTSEPDYSTEESNFIRAMDLYMTNNRRRFPTFREVLAVFKSLGYRQTEPSSEPPKFVVKGNGSN